MRIGIERIYLNVSRLNSKKVSLTYAFRVDMSWGLLNAHVDIALVAEIAKPILGLECSAQIRLRA